METSGTYVDELPVAALPGRYSVVRSQIYNRINALGIETVKRGNKSFVTAEQLAHLDQLHDLLNKGMSLEQAAAELLARNGEELSDLMRQSYKTVQDSPIRQSYPVGQLDWMQVLMTAFATGQAVTQANPLQRFEQLQAMADHGWRPSTGELAAILGLKTLSGQMLERYGFRFTREGKNGAQSAWRVERI